MLDIMRGIAHTVLVKQREAREDKDMTLTKRCAVYVPMGLDMSDAVLTEVKKSMAHMFGGVTIVKVEGGWIDAEGKYIKDDIAIAYSYYDPEDFTGMAVENFLEVMADIVRSTLSQDCVSIELDGELHIIETVDFKA